jgi:protein-L-isoaspartate(D-aspartate) O-methyltransferase
MSDVYGAGRGLSFSPARERLVQHLRAQGIQNTAVLERIRSVPRHLFVEEGLASRAYEDRALPIGLGQTISQPYMVAWMTEALLAGGPLGKVLEVGTGSGYQTAVLAPLVTELYTIERIEALLMRARERLEELGIRNVRWRHGDGASDWESEAPFDGILVAAAPLQVPEELVRQLAAGGRLLMPLGPAGNQELVRFTRDAERVQQESLGPVAFVPLLRGTAEQPRRAQ